ncbi:IniB N-terminal domain-containing protein [Amycolatopsis sp., V23-08]|uniref:IniB N-terminal domain-containing protein n=1 Tax=Amycolatopsis heterodermiae TaxID=3110235 RepID=A0ABU5RG09_9PSEU|nr:IniB N-terminal domain-containing protein [Amycolatopsis sp., V23-08]MEA5364509.1 IniB N-terminal domain-containing protein [Amycolatopsis sp., V23-08]
MDSVQTLHDFALNLLNDPTALAAFGTDPQQALALAGLGDVSAADVHEVIPLVLDYVPVDSLPAVGGLPLVGDLSSLGTDTTGIQGAIDQLTALTAGLGLPATSALPGVGDLGVGELPGLGDLPVGELPVVTDVTNSGNVTALAGNVTSVIIGGDLASGLDSAALANLTAAPAYLTDANQIAQLTTLAEQPLVGGVGTAHTIGTEVLSAVSGPVGDVTSHTGDLTGGVSNLTDVASHVGDFTGILKGTSDLDIKHVTTEVSHVAHGVGDVTSTVTSATGLNVDHNVLSGVGDIAGGNGTAVHDVVSDVTDVSHNALGNLHIGDIASNDIHLGH